MSSSPQWHPIEDISARQVSEAEEGQIFRVKVSGKKLGVVWFQEKWWAFAARCPHAGGRLTAGRINEQCEVVCPLHRFAFSLESGKCNSGGYFIDTYPVKKEQWQLWVALPPKKFLGLF
jgi:nitrite reductase/ring-hydroxylating ferredoxin subunit